MQLEVFLQRCVRGSDASAAQLTQPGLALQVGGHVSETAPPVTWLCSAVGCSETASFGVSCAAKATSPSAVQRASMAHVQVAKALSLACFGGMIATNGLALDFMIKGMRLAGTTTHVVLTTTVQTLLTVCWQRFAAVSGAMHTLPCCRLQAILSIIVFSEELPLLWWLGATTMLLGVLLIQQDGVVEESQHALSDPPSTTPAPPTPPKGQVADDTSNLRRSPRLRHRTRREE